jgi:hypothetical protein
MEKRKIKKNRPKKKENLSHKNQKISNIINLHNIGLNILLKIKKNQEKSRKIKKNRPKKNMKKNI